MVTETARNGTHDSDEDMDDETSTQAFPRPSTGRLGRSDARK